ncbi:MAG: hypothetical protein ACOY40_10595 [Bacillota bacterium]
MQWNGIKVPVVILALVVGLAALWGAQWLYNRYNYERPLTKLLGENKDVVSYKINDEGPVLAVEVKLGKVDNLQQSYDALHQSLQGVVGRRDFKIILRDERDATLDGICYQARLAAYEALERGNFLEMESLISQRAAREGSQARLMLDEDRLYIQITHGNHYLYEIIPRTKVAGAVSSGERGSPS